MDIKEKVRILQAYMEQFEELLKESNKDTAM